MKIKGYYVLSADMDEVDRVGREHADWTPVNGDLLTDLAEARREAQEAESDGAHLMRGGGGYYVALVEVTEVPLVEGGTT